MKKVLLFLFICCGMAAKGQHYYNEWIDYSKTYYKFKLAKTGLYRIPQATLAAAGLDGQPAESFQLWRNGVQIPIYTSVASGTLSATDYIEFWGEMNDGKPDNELYKNPRFQLNDKWSLETDSATFFLTVNPAGSNLRLSQTPNNTATNTLAPEPYFMYTAGTYYRDQLNPGFAINVGEYLYSSSYDNGEGWTSVNLDSSNMLTTTLNNLYVYPSGPDATLNFAAFGKAMQQRRVGVILNNAVIDTTQHMDYFDSAQKSYSIPISSIAKNTAVIQFVDLAAASNDQMVIAKHELTYPRLFNFGGASNFAFTLAAKSSQSYLEISNFSYGASAPVLYDITNGQRYVGDISAAPLVKFLLNPSATDRNLVLVNYDPANTTPVTSLEQRKFINYTDPAYASKYMIITNKQLLSAADGSNAVEDYRAYRSSAAGGGYDAKIYLEDELADQFGYGIKKNPIAIRNFILYARNHFSPAQVFIIGKGVNYTAQYSNQSDPNIDKLNLVPTFGWPASDALLTADPGTSIPQLPFGRLSAINGHEVAIYLSKVKEFEQAQAALSPNRQDREWMKNVVHLNGINDPGLKETIDAAFDNYKNIITDTLFGGNVTTFEKNSTSSVEDISNSTLDELFRQGITLMTYFGHSGSNTLGYNLDDPQAYDNQGKYPLFIALGCNAGDFFNFNTKRFSINETLSEKYVLAPGRGTIGFIASTHFGIVHYLDVWNTQAYKALAATDYGAPIGDIIVKAAKGVFDVENPENFYARANVEETELHGDPALRLNPHAKPDYVIDESLVKITPDFISVAEPFFKVACRFVNIGRAINKSVTVEVKREYPNGTAEVVYRDTLSHLYYTDSLSFNLPIDALRDKGINKITVTVDADNEVDELYETNNSVTKQIVIYVDELKPVYPNNFAIVNKPDFKFITSTANPFSTSKQYRFELDTTELFNSPAEITQSVTSPGGLIEFSPGITYTANTVYYWRVAAVSDSGKITWNTASFIYMPDHAIGFNQSHLYQKFKLQFENIYLDSASQELHFTNQVNNLFIKAGVWGTGATSEGDMVVNVNGDSYIRNTCWFDIIFNVFDKGTFKPWTNSVVNGQGLYGSIAPCAPTRINNFEFTNDTAGRRKAYAFLKSVPDGDFVVVRNQVFSNPAANQYVQDWINDKNVYGAGNTLYDLLKKYGFSTLDSFNRVRVFAAVLKKNDPGFVPKQRFSEGAYDVFNLSVDCPSPGSQGIVTSPQFGPAKQWKQLEWQGHSLETVSTDHPTLDIIGIRTNGKNDTLYKNINQSQQTFDLSGVNALQYPYLQLQLNDLDSINFTPYQLDYWRLTHVPVPEGALAPNLYLNMKDTLEAGEPFDMQIAFKNVSETPFDSLKIKLVVTDANNVQHVLPMQREHPLGAGDTLHVHYNLDTRQFGGLNSLYVEVNPDNDQIEQYHFNNYASKSFFVRVDSLNPNLDVTFDAVHILNNDIVSSKPHIVMKLKDEAKWALLTDTSLFKVQVRYPDGSVHPFHFTSDTLQFIAAQTAQNNTATVNLNPTFEEDGIYELQVSGKDESGNKAGAMTYRVAFEVINKPMISNMMNYPNPFTTSTAFVFTITGSEIPQELKVEILTITGKVVREITRQELGPLHIGRNITEYKWNGTDQYGQKLGNGVYLYRVVTSLNGKTLDKYKAQQDNTDKYFNKGYGKMYLMR